MRKFIGLTAMTVLAACAGNAPKDYVKGVVTDATMETVTVVSEAGDTLSFSTLDADRSQASGVRTGDTLELFFKGRYRTGMEAQKIVRRAAEPLVGGQRDEHGCLTSAGYIWSEARQDCIRLFESGLCLEATDGGRHVMYVLFSPDSLKAELFHTGKLEKSILLDRHTLPSGAHVWNVEDDDTYNLRYANGAWSVERRGKRLFGQTVYTDDSQLGDWREQYFEAALPTRDGQGLYCALEVRHREHSGNGTFRLQFTYTEKDTGKESVFSYTGSRLTLRGTPDDPDATVWQLRPDNSDAAFNFLCEGKDTLLLLNGEFEPPQPKSKYRMTLFRK